MKKTFLLAACLSWACACDARGVFINSDAWNFFFTGKDWRGHSVEQLKREIEKDVDWYADKGGVEAIFYNLNFQRCFWPTKVGTPYWKDLEVDAATNLWLRGVKLTEKDGASEYLRMFLTAKPMWEKFPDFLKYRYAYCHKKGVEMWHSLRVNDVHHAQKGGEGRPQHGDLWRTRPDLHRAEYRTVGKHGWSDRSFDYGKDEVRAYHLGLAREYLLDYESDGMELDFMRHAPFFKPGYDEANAPLMTQFVRDVRKLCDAAEKKWGHKLRIAVRVPAYPADALGLGMDVPAWVREKLVDVVIPSPMGLETVSDTQVALWRVVCPPPIVLAPCIDYLLRIRWEARLLFDTPTDLGFASSFYNQGADTVYFYNHYPRDRDTHPDMPDAFATCGDRAAVAKRARRCVLTDGSPAGEGRYWTSRFPVWGMSPNNFCGGAKINVGDDVAGRAAQVVVGASCDLAVDVYVNGEKCAMLDASMAPKPLPKLRQVVVAQIPDGVLHDGWNLVELVNRGKENLGEWRIAWCEIDVDAEAAAPSVAFDLRATPQADGTRSAAVTVGGVRSALPDGSTAVRGAAATGDGAHVFVVHGLGRYNLPATQLERGWINSSALSVFDGATGKRINTVLLDDAQAGAANPWGVAVNDDWIAVAHAGVHELSLIPRAAFLAAVLAAKDDLSTDLGFMARIGRRRIAFKGKGPRAVRFRADGKVEVDLHFAEATAVVDPNTGAVAEPDLPGGVSAAVAADPVRRGEALFHDASVCYQGWQSCSSCHVDGRNDGLRWDFPNSGGGLGHPEETVDLSRLEELSPTCVKNSFRDDCLYQAPADDVSAVEAYVCSLFGNVAR